MKYLLWFLRIVLGLVFIFSGIVKANDPLGLAYKMQDIFEAWHMEYMVQYSFWFSVLMIAFEIIAGVAIIVGNSFRLYVGLMLAINVFYLFLTGYILYSGNIKECGCFGDCFKISNVETFGKDVILTAINFILFIFRYRVFPIFQKPSINFSIVMVSVVFSAVFQWWTLNFLPVHDCLPYKVGSNLSEKMKPAANYTPAVYESVLTYEKNGVKKEFAVDKIPWQDKSWTYVSTNTKLVKEAIGEPEIHDFVLTDFEGTDKTADILSAKGYTFLWFLRQPDKANMKKLNVLHDIINNCKKNHIRFYVLASVSMEMCKTYQDVWDMKDVTFLLIDGTVNKTAMRSNPGLLLLHDGVVEGKWSFLDYPKNIEFSDGNLKLK